MKTTEELQAKISELEDRLRVLEESTISADGITIGDIVSLSKEFDSLKKEIHLSKQSPAVPSQLSRNSTPPVKIPDYAKPSSSLNPQTIRTIPKSPHKKRITEGNIGRYGVGILASILILLAVGTAASAFWEYIPNVIKFIFFLAAGVVCEGIGWKKVQKSGVKNGFWTSLTGLGAAISFISIVFGEGVWTLYPTIFTGIALIAWFAVNFFISTKADSKVFFSVTYIGGIIAASLTFSGGLGIEREILIVLMTAVIYGIGKFGAIKAKKTFLSVLNLIFLWTIFCQIKTVLMSVQIILNSQTMCAPYVPRLLIFFQLAIAIASLLEAANVTGKKPKNSLIIPSLLPFLSSLMVISAVNSLTNLSGISAIFPHDATEPLLTLTILCLCGLAVYRKNWDKYILGISPAITVTLAILSQTTLGFPPILPALLIILLISHPTFREKECVRAAAVIAYLIAFSETPIIYEQSSSSLSQFSGLLLLMIIPILNYARIYLRQDGVLPELEELGGVIFPALAFRRLVLLFGGSNMLWIAVLAGLLFAHKYLIPCRQRSVRENERELAQIGMWVVTGWICLCCYTGGIFMPDAADKIIVTALLVLYSSMSAYKAVKSQSVGWAIASAVFSHFNLFFVSGMWNSGDADILVSIFGLLLSAAFVGIGFWKKQKYMRAAGLSTMITYVFKIAVLDVAQDGDTGMRILVLLLGGIVCFGVSFAYNKLNKLYGDSERDSSESNTQL